MKLTATDIALKVLSKLDRSQQVTVYLALQKQLFAPPHPVPRPDNSFNQPTA